MRTLSILILGVLCLVGVTIPANSAEFMYRDYPYYIFNDKDTIRWCIDPVEGAATTDCWTEGKKTECIVLPPEQGYIDCRDNESKPLR